jgi:hypothetical protein
MEVLNAWTDALHRVLAPLGLSLLGENASSIFPVSTAGRVLASLGAVADNEWARIAAEANA